MSHNTVVETVIKEEATLRETIRELGYHIVEDKLLKGYHEDLKVEFQIQTGKAYNVGFRKEGNEFAIIGDPFYVRNFSTMQRNILQRYSSKIVERNARAMGYTLVKRTTNKDKSIAYVWCKR